MKSWNFYNHIFTTKVIYVYTIFLSLLSIFFIVNPVIAQTDVEKEKNTPEKKINVTIEYDDEGNIIKYDSCYSWSWSGNVSSFDFDSILNGFNYNFDNFHFNYDDSISDIDQFLFNPFSFQFDSTFNNYIQDWKNKFNDEEFSKQQDEFLKHQQEFLEHFESYMDEHRKLIEKYFEEPFFKSDSIIYLENRSPSNTPTPVIIKIKSI